MRRIYLYIIAMLALALAASACTATEDEPRMILGPDGQVPLAFTPMEANRSRAEDPLHDIRPFIQLHGTAYDMYCCGVTFGRGTTGIYTKDLNHGDEIFNPMMYDATTLLLFSEQFFYPAFGNLGLYSFGVERENGTVGTPVNYHRDIRPNLLLKPDPTNAKKMVPDYMSLDLTAQDASGNYLYDGSYDIIAADTMKVVCTTELSEKMEPGQPSMLPYAHYYHIMAHISVKVQWASGVSANTKDRITINYVRTQNTPCRGKLRVYDKIADAVWEELPEKMDDARLTNGAVDKHLPDAGLNLASIYVVPRAKRQNLVVNYTIKNGIDGEEEYRTVNYSVTDPNATDGWLSGHKYVYTITMGEMGDVKISGVKVTTIKYTDGTVGDTIIK